MNKAKSYASTKLALLFIIIPIFIGLICIFEFGVSVPYWDEWDIQTKTLKNYYENNLSLGDLLSQHNESRPFFPRIVLLIVDLITDYNIVAEMILLYLVYCFSFVLIFFMFKKDNSRNKAYLWLFIPLSWFYFNLDQIFNNMLYGMFLLTGLMILGFLGSVYLLDLSKGMDKKYLFALVAAIISSFSFIAGLTVWPVCLIQLILQKSNYKIQKLIIWIATAITTILIYYYDYQKPGHIPSLMECFYNPFQALLVFFSSFGLSIFRDPDLSAITGILMILLILVLIIEKILTHKMLLDSDVKWISLILFSVLASLEISIGRTGLGLDNAISQRYFWEAFLNIIGLYSILLNHIQASNQNSDYVLFLKQPSRDMHQSNGYLLWSNLNYVLFGVTIILLFLGSAAHSLDGINDVYEIKQAKLDMVYYLKTFEIQPDESLKLLYPTADTVRNLAPFLKKNKLNVFSEREVEIASIKAANEYTLGNLDIINDQSVVNQDDIIPILGEKMELIGWAVDSKEKKPAKAVFIGFGENINIPAQYGLERKDVADFFSKNNYKYSGFKASFTPNILANGSYNLTIKVLPSNEEEYYKVNIHNLTLFVNDSCIYARDFS